MQGTGFFGSLLRGASFTWLDNLQQEKREEGNSFVCVGSPVADESIILLSGPSVILLLFWISSMDPLKRTYLSGPFPPASSSDWLSSSLMPTSSGSDSFPSSSLSPSAWKTLRWDIKAEQVDGSVSMVRRGLTAEGSAAASLLALALCYNIAWRSLGALRSLIKGQLVAEKVVPGVGLFGRIVGRVWSNFFVPCRREGVVPLQIFTIDSIRIKKSIGRKKGKKQYLCLFIF